MQNKIRGALKVASNRRLVLRGAFKMLDKIQGGNKNCFQLLRGALFLPKIIKGGRKKRSGFLHHFSEN